MSPISQRETVPANAVWMGGLHVPACWTRTKVKHLVRTMRAGEVIPLDEISESGLFPVYGANGKRGYTSDKTHEGTYILIGRQGARCGNVHLASGAFWASEHAIVSAPAEHVNPNWLAYLLDVMNLGQYSTNAAQPGIGVGQIATLPVYIPGFDEQRAIANFLDSEIAQIDALIGRQALLIDALRERRIAVITATALGMRHEGGPGERDLHRWGASLAVETALAARPPHWRLERFKSMCHAREERNSLANEVMLSLTIAGQLVDRAEAGGRQEPAEENIPRYFVAHPGDLVVNPMWLTGGSIGVTDKRGAVSPDYRVFKLHPDIDPWYLHAVLRSTPYFDQYKLYTRSSTTFDRRIKQVDLDNLPLPVPPIEEQRKIIDQIDEQAAKIDALIAKTRQHIEFAKERRAALISAAVTGQIDVTGRSAAS